RDGARCPTGSAAAPGALASGHQRGRPMQPPGWTLGEHTARAPGRRGDPLRSSWQGGPPAGAVEGTAARMDHHAAASALNRTFDTMIALDTDASRWVLSRP